MISRAVWLYFRFTLSLRDVEEILARDGILVTYETVRKWTRKFGQAYAQRLRAKRPAPSPRWHLDEIQIRIAAKKHYVWRAVDDEGEVLDCVVSRRRTMPIAMELMQKLLANQPVKPERIVTDQYKCYEAPMYFLGLRGVHIAGSRHENNRAENSHLPIRLRERKMQGFKSVASTQAFLDSHAPIYNTFNVQPHIASRTALRELRARAFAAWDAVVA